MSTEKNPTPPGQEVSAEKKAENVERKANKVQESKTPEPTTEPVPQKPADPVVTSDSGQQNVSDVPIDVLVELVNLADQEFSHIGGGAQDWLEKAFLPLLAERHIIFKTYL